MARGSNQATQAATAGLDRSNQLGGQSGALYSTLAPQLQAQAASPPGINPTDLAAINTAGQESAGGAQAAAVGQGSLMANRTRNAGSADAAIDASTREAGAQANKGALTAQILNAKTKQDQQAQALQGEEGLYGTTTGAANQALGIVPGAVNANTNAANSNPWDKYLTTLLGNAKYTNGGVTV